MSDTKDISKMDKLDLFAIKTELNSQKKEAELHLSELNDRYRKHGPTMAQKDYNKLVDEQAAVKEKIHQLSAAALDVKQALRTIAIEENAEREAKPKAESLYNYMTLRDHFAGLAMQGVLASVGYEEKKEVSNSKDWNFFEDLANKSYGMADLMLKAREQ